TAAGTNTITPAAGSITSGALATNVIASSIAVAAINNGNQFAATLAIPTANIDLSTVTTKFATKASSGTNADLSAFIGAGTGITISTQVTLTSSMTLVNVPLTFSGASGAIVSVSSITAGAFYGDASHLSNVTASNVAAANVTAGALATNVIASSVAATAVTVGSYGSATAAPSFTV